MLNNLELYVAIRVVIWCASVDYRQSNNNIRFHLRRFILCGVLFVWILFRSHLFDIWREKTEPNYIMSLWSDVYFRIAIDVSSRILPLSLSLSFDLLTEMGVTHTFVNKLYHHHSIWYVEQSNVRSSSSREREWEYST